MKEKHTGLSLEPSDQQSTEERNQFKTLGMPLRSSDFDRIEEENPFTKMASNPEGLHRCVDKVKAKGSASDPWAVCQASLSRGK